MLASGSPSEIAKVLRDMKRLKFDKELSFGERRLLDQAQALLVEELALALDETAEAVAARVDSIFSS
jgi:CarD family transcriptional regulator